MAKFDRNAKWGHREQRRKERDAALSRGIGFPAGPRFLSKRTDGFIVDNDINAVCLNYGIISPVASPTEEDSVKIVKIIENAVELCRQASFERMREHILWKAYEGSFDPAESKGFFTEEEVTKIQCMALEISLIQVELLKEFGENIPEVVTTVGVYPNGPSNTNGVTLKDLPYHIWYNERYRPGRALIVNGVCWYGGLGVDIEKIECEKDHYKDLIHQSSTAPYH